jgi:hypothetical protein
MAMGQVSSGYVDFLCQFSFYGVLHIHHHLSSGTSTIGQIVTDVPSGLSLTPPQKTKTKTKMNFVTIGILSILVSLYPVVDSHKIQMEFYIVGCETLWQAPTFRGNMLPPLLLNNVGSGIGLVVFRGYREGKHETQKGRG